MRSVERFTPATVSLIPASTQAPEYKYALAPNISFVNQAQIPGPQHSPPDDPVISDSIVIKQEPMDVDVVDAHCPRTGKLPRLLNYYDQAEATGMRQGPLREELMNVNADQLAICRADKKGLPENQVAYVTEQMRRIVKAMQEGKHNDACSDCYHIFHDEEHPELGFGLKAARKIAPYEVLPDIYGGFVLSNAAQCHEMYENVDSRYSVYLFETRSYRPRSAKDKRPKPLNIQSGIAGHLRHTALPLINTAVVSENKVLRSDMNNLIAIRTNDRKIIFYMAIKQIEKDQPFYIDYHDTYRVQEHQPTAIKVEPDDSHVEAMSTAELPSGLSWLAENIEKPDKWIGVSAEVLAPLIALTRTFQQQNALLVITEKEKNQNDRVISVVDSLNGELVHHQELMNSTRKLAVIQYVADENHYNAIWSSGGKVTVTQEENVYRVDNGKKNKVKIIRETAFSMTDAAAFSLFKARKDKTIKEKSFSDTMITSIHGYGLRKEIKNIILTLPENNQQLVEELEKKIPNIKSFPKAKDFEAGDNDLVKVITSNEARLVKDGLRASKKNGITAYLLKQFKSLPVAKRNRNKFIKKHGLVPATAMKYITANGHLTLRGKQRIQLAEGHKFSNPTEAINEWRIKTEEERSTPKAKENLAIKYNVLFETLDSVLCKSGVNIRGMKSLQRLKSYARNQIEEKNYFQPEHMKELQELLMHSDAELSQQSLLSFCQKNNLDENKLHYFFKDNKFTPRGRTVLNRRPGEDDRITADLIREWMDMGEARKNYGAKTTFCERNNISRSTLQIYATTDGLRKAGEKIMQVEHKNEEIMAAMLKWSELTQEERNEKNSIRKFSKQNKVAHEAFRQKVLVRGVFQEKGITFLLERGISHDEINNIIVRGGGFNKPASLKKVTVDIIEGYRNIHGGYSKQAFAEYCHDVDIAINRLVRYIGANGRITFRGKEKYKKTGSIAGTEKN